MGERDGFRLAAGKPFPFRVLLHRPESDEEWFDVGPNASADTWMVHRVQVHAVDAACRQVADLFGRVGDTRLFKQRGVAPPLVKQDGKFFRNTRFAHLRHAQHRLRVHHRHDAGFDRNVDAGGTSLVHESKEILVVVEQLGDEVAYARVDLLLEIVDILLKRGRLRCFSG